MKRTVVMKLALGFALSVIGVVVLAAALDGYLFTKLMDEQEAVSGEQLDVIGTLLTEMRMNEAQETGSFDSENAAKADAVALMARTLWNFEYTDEYLGGLCESLGAYDLEIINKNGGRICGAGSGRTDYATNRFNRLRAACATGKASEPFTVRGTDGETPNLRYYGSRIDPERMVVLTCDTLPLERKLAAAASLEDTLGHVYVEQGGMLLAVSPVDYAILYHADRTKIGRNAVLCGLNADALFREDSERMTVDGVECLATMRLIDGKYIVYAIPMREIEAHKNSVVITAGIVAFVLFTAFNLYVLYTAFEKGESGKKRRKELPGSLTALAAAFAPLIFFAALYPGKLYSLSRQSGAAQECRFKTEETLNVSKSLASYYTELHNDAYLEKARIAAELLKKADDSSLTLRFMQDLNAALRTENIWYFGTDGATIASSNPNWSFRLSENEQDQSYVFRQIVNGSRWEVVQEPMVDDSGRSRQYFAVAMHNGRHKTIGAVQIEVLPETLEMSLISTEMSSVLQQIRISNNGFAFAVDRETGRFLYYPQEELIGLDASLYGVVGDSPFSDYMTVNGDKYFVVTFDYDDATVYIAVPVNSYGSVNFRTALLAAGISLLWMLLLTVWHCTGDRGSGRPETAPVQRYGSRVLERAAAEIQVLEERTPGQKVLALLKLVLIAAGILLAVLVAGADRFFPDNSIFIYILRGTWRKGLNIFALSKCLILCTLVITGTGILRRVLTALATRVSANGETVCRMVNSAVKFASMLVLIYLCLLQVGVDSAALLTSAGILSLVIGLGANSLIKDVLEGLMIVFEDSFRVGDYVTVGDFRGRVTEIGIRATKIRDEYGNVKILCNSSLGDVLNMTKELTDLYCEIGISYEEDLERVEKLFPEELAAIGRKYPEIKEGPFYCGVSELGDSEVELTFVIRVDESVAFRMRRAFRRELLLMIERNNINVPYTQIVVHRAEEE